MKLISFNILFSTLVFNCTIAQAMTTCFSNSHEVEGATLMQKVVKAPENYFWSGFKLNEGPIVLFSSVEKVHPVLNVSLDDLKKLGLKIDECKELPSLIVVLGEYVEKPAQNPVYDFYKPNDPRDNLVSKIAAQQSKTTLYMSMQKIEVDKNGNPVNIDPISSVRIAVHEAFHSMFQFSGGYQFNFSDFKKFQRDLAISCSAKLVQPEVAILRTIIRKWREIDNSELRQLLLQTLAHRQSVTGDENRFCYQNFAFWERIEGMAHFIDIKTVEFLLGAENVPDTDILDGQNEFFYFTGSVYARALERLFPESRWQQEVNLGAMPHEILGRLFESQNQD